MFYRHEFDSFWPFGGYTLAIDREKALIGISVCSVKDQFSRPTGRANAEKRMESANGDGKLWIITAPVAESGITSEILRQALSNAVGFVVNEYPNSEFGVQFV